ncbi:MAG: cytochrome c biogenesis protein ResB [Coraliomargaritaceae bacterium]
MKAISKALSSLRLTVVLLSLSMVLIFFGTLAQVETGIWKTQKDYFESFLVVWSYPQVWAGYEKLYWLRIPMPGGYTLGGLLLVNLSAAFLTRFKAKWSKLGIHAIHIGLITLLVSELLTDILSVESKMAIDEKGRSNYSFSYQENELAFIDRSHPEQDTVHSIPTDALKPAKTIAVPNSPLSIRTLSYYPNAQLIQGKGAVQSPATQGAGPKMNIQVVPRPMDYSDNEVNAATAYIEVFGPEGSLGTWLVSNLIDERFPPQTVSTGDQSWEIALRFQRYYHPFDVELIDFTHDRYPGTEIPFNFSSEVIVHPHDSSAATKALIYMNHPLRYAGLTFYQASFSQDEQTTILQVVRNPGWLLPYVSVLLMGFGMSYQFALHFSGFLRKRTAA